MKLGKIAGSAESRLHSFTKGITYIASATLFLMMLLVAADVTGRYAFNKPIKGALEVDELMMGVMVFLSFAYCTSRKGHVVVEIVLYRLPKHTQSILNGITSIVSAFIIAIITWQMAIRGWSEMFSPTGSITMLLSIPISPFMLLAAIGYALMTIELLINSFHYFTEKTV